MQDNKLTRGEENLLAMNNQGSRIKVRVYGSPCYICFDTSVFLLGKEGVVMNHDDFVYYNSTKRAILPDDKSKGECYYFTHFYEASPTPFDKEIFGTKKNWKQMTRPLSSDCAVLGVFDDLSDEDMSDDGRGATETINIDLNKIDQHVSDIVIYMSLAPWTDTERELSFKESFSEVGVEIVDSDSEMAIFRYDIIDESFFSYNAAELGKLYVNNTGNWVFKAMGEGYHGGLQTLVDKFTE